MPSRPLLTIGSRGSRLALAQAHAVRDRLVAAGGALAEPGALEVTVIRTSGDRITDRPLAEFGGKGLFTREIDEAVLDGRVDIAVHSMKDVPTWLPDGIEIACLLPREDPRDAFFSQKATTIAGLPERASVGTASLRRAAQMLERRPDLRVENFRGNVETRIRKLRDGVVDATLLAMAGLRRLGLLGEETAILSADELLPAVGQGAIGIACRRGDARVSELVAPFHDHDTAACVAAERAMLAALDGSCRTPIAGLAEIGADGRLTLRSLLARPDGTQVFRATRSGAPAEAAALGADAGADLRAQAGDDFVASLG